MFSIEQLRLATGQTINLELGAGQIHCLRGDSGVGKTRLLRALADLDPCQGELRLHGQPCCEFPAPQWRQQVMLVPARPQWWLPCAADHMTQPMAASAQRIRLDTEPLNGPASRLSTGESTRLALLRALSREPAVLLLDEPTAALDDDAETAVEALLKDYVSSAPQRALLWVTHSKQQAQRVADRQWRLTETSLEQLS